jgi:hypothetical protein
MTRLQSELNRLYLAAPAPPGGGAPSFFDAQGRVRALVLEVVQPATWASLSAVWQGVQAELDLPAPAIAVSGTDGLQLWFSLEAAIGVDSAHAFLDSLHSCFLADLPLARVRLRPDPAMPTRHAALVPALTEATGNWSAFVAPDLAAVFSHTPWLDVAPGDEGQAALLRGLRSIKRSAFEAAVARLDALARDAQAREPAAQTPAAAATRSEANEPTDDPRGFLLRVMNDESVPLALRIEAAKALLPRH